MLTGTELPSLVTAPPGPASQAWVERLIAVECPAITARRARRVAAGGTDPIVWAEARGANVIDADGNRYVDLSAGFAVSAVGHAHPRVVEAGQRQLARLPHGMGDLFPTREKIALGEKLAALTPGDLQHSIFGLNGSDAIEAAIKTALIATGRSRVLAFSSGYHGMSLGALGVSGYRDDFRRPFAGFAGRQELRLPYAHCGACPLGLRHPECGLACARYVDHLLGDDTSGSEDIAAIVVEPIQGRGGDIVPPAGWLRALRDLCDRRGILLIADEIYTGFGRTGRWWGCDHDGVVPDLICVGKAMGGGFPISACVGRPAVMEAWGTSKGESIHTATFLGNPLGCAMALAAIEVIESEGLVDRAQQLGARLRDGLTAALHHLPWVGPVRGAGLMLGVPLVDEAGQPRPGGGVTAMQRLLNLGFIVSPGGPQGDVMSLSPPFVLTETQADAFVEACGIALATPV
jgi:4-aminobutyrate aminotransferase/(S)-3-amino-2-methylpropionate transaminase